jgi:hypothetical protein
MSMSGIAPALRGGAMSMSRGTCVLLWLVLGVLGCRERGATIDLPPLLPPSDGGVEDPALPDGAVPCRRDADCDDGVDCTRDVCAPGRFCVNAANGARCSDDVYCNGDEVCDPEVGCRPSTPRRCSDDDVCTVDYCDEQGKRCAHEPRDFDDDGEVDWHCIGGTDCDDFDATRSRGVAEVCSDGVDNDCDDAIDELTCGRPEHDRCDDALDVSAGGRFVVSLGGAAPDYSLGCSTEAARDLAFTFTIDKPRDVTLIATGLLGDDSEETATIAVRSDCADLRTEIECSHGFPGQVRIRALPPGRYFAIVNSELSAQLVLEARFADATDPPPNRTCEAPIDISAGGRFEGDFVDVGDDATLPCGFPGAHDLVYTFTTEEERDVELSAISVTGERMNFAVRTACDDPQSTLRCISAAPARARLHQLPAGTYFVVIESSPAREVDFSLEAAFLDPTPPPPGDSCFDPLDLPIGMEVNGTLANRQDLVGVAECGCNPESTEQGCGLFWPDTVYRVQVDEPMDLSVTIDAGGSLLAYDFRSICDSQPAQLACGQGATIGARVRNLQAGDYFLVVESADPTNFTVALETLPRTVPIPVGGNDTCATAVEVPLEGALFAGDTLGMLNNYEALCGSGARSGDAAFRLELTERARVTASLEAAFDTVLYRYLDTGAGAAACNVLGSACNDDGGHGNTNSLLSDTLEPGVYYYVVDGFGETNSGSYLLEMTIEPP